MRRSTVDHIKAARGRLAPILPVLLLSGFLITCPGAVRAQTSDTWNPAVTSGIWNNAANWSSGVPNNGTPAGTTYNVFITNPTSSSAAVSTSGIDPTISGLTISSGNSLTIANATSLTIADATTISNAGTITLGSSGSTTAFVIEGNVTLSGGGTLSMSNNSNNEIFSSATSPPFTLTNSAGNTIQGSGQLGDTQLNLNNAGIVNANQTTALVINPGSHGSVTNTGTLEATAGGTLTLQGTYNNAGGTIAAGSSTPSTTGTVNITGSVTGGTLTSFGVSALNVGGGTLTDVTISSGSTATVQNATTTSLGTGTITNNGTLALNSAGSTTAIQITGNVTLGGGGTLSMSNNSNNEIFSSATSPPFTLTNSAGNTIQGSGQLGDGQLNLNNAGIVNANQSTALVINPGNNGSVTNTGTLEATAGGTLTLQGTYNNAGGTIAAGSSTPSTTGTVNITGSVTGGTLTSFGVSALNVGGGTLTDVTISSGSTATVQNATTTSLGTGTITNNGSLALNSTGSTTAIQITGNVTLGGGGTLSMSNNSNNEIFSSATSPPFTLTNSVGNTIQGSGQLGDTQLNLNNAGIVNANQTTALVINPGSHGSVTNTGTLEATAGGTLTLQGTYNNAGGTIAAGSSTPSTTGTVNITGSVTGGTLTSFGVSALNVGGGTLTDVTISSGSTATVQNATTTSLGTGTITNNGTLALNSAGSTTAIQITGNVTLGGGGTLSMSNNSNNEIFSSATSPPFTLTNSAGNTIQGSGQLGDTQLNLNNAGIVNANQSTALVINPGSNGSVTNTGTLEATAGGTLNLQGSYNPSATSLSGTILATGNNGSGTNSTVNITGTVNESTLTTQNGGVMNAGNGTLSNVTISGGSTVNVQNATVTTLVGTITNNGTLALNSTGSTTAIQIKGDVTLSGGGTLAMSNNSNNEISSTTSAPASTLTNGAGHTIEGSGQLGDGQLKIVNNGTILANQSTNLVLNPGSGNSATNNGTFQANSGSTLVVSSGLTNYTASTSTLTGGTYNALSGIIQLNQANATAGTPAVIATNAATILLDGASAKITDGSGHNILNTFLATNTAAGSLTIQNGAGLTSASSGFANAGTVNIGANSTFLVGGSHDYVQSGGTTTLTAGTSLLEVASGHSVDLNGGTLQGIGTISGNLSNTGGTILPGTPGVAGTLTVTGNYSDPQGTSLDIQIGGTPLSGDFSQFHVGGTAALGGTLDVSLINGFVPHNGDQYEILTSGGLSGTFTDSVIHDGNITFTVEYSPAGFSNDVLLSVSLASVPEPASIVMLGLGLAGLGTYLARRSRKTAQG